MTVFPISLLAWASVRPRVHVPRLELRAHTGWVVRVTVVQLVGRNMATVDVLDVEHNLEAMTRRALTNGNFLEKWEVLLSKFRALFRNSMFFHIM